MHIDRQRERLRDRVATLATLVERAFVTTFASASEQAMVPSERLIDIQDDIVGLAHSTHADAIEFLVRFRPVATDLQFVTTALGCSADLQVAAVAIDGVAGLWERLEPTRNADLVPSLDRMMACTHAVVSMASDAIGSWDARGYEAIRAARGDLRAVRELVRSEVAKAAMRPTALVEGLLDADTASCLLDRVASASAACVRRLTRTSAAEPLAPLVPS